MDCIQMTEHINKVLKHETKTSKTFPKFLKANNFIDAVLYISVR